jgi:hypothetical protein
MKNSEAVRGWQAVFLRACATLAPADWTGWAERLRELTPLDWQNVGLMAERHGLIGLVSRAMDWAGDELSVSIPVRAQLATWRQGQLLQLMARRGAARRVAQALSSRGIDFVIYKGVALSEEVYGDLSLRGYGDCDILVRPGTASTAFEVLCDLGFVPAPGVNVQQQMANGIAAIAMKRSDLSIDLHWTLSAGRLFMNDSEQIWSNCGPPSRPNALAGWRMSPELTLVNLAEHFCRHSFLELKPLVDFRMAAAKFGDAVDPGALAKLAQSLDLDSMVDLTARLSERLLAHHPSISRLISGKAGLRTQIACAVLTERALVRIEEPRPIESRLRRLVFGSTPAATLGAVRTMLLPRTQELESRFRRPFDLRMYPQYYAIQARRVLTRSNKSFDRYAGLAPTLGGRSRADVS